MVQYSLVAPSFAASTTSGVNMTALSDDEIRTLPVYSYDLARA